MPRGTNQRTDLEGRRFGRWIVGPLTRIKRYRSSSAAYWICRCDCGAAAEVLGWNLTSGKSKSCGCLNIEACTTHRQSQKRIYKLWALMIARCRYPTASHYANYGGRGIKVCDRWLKFANFYADMGDPPSRRHSLDRKKVDGDYGPGNVVWATPAEQNRNKRCNKLTDQKAREIRALAMSIPKKEIAARYGVSRVMVSRVVRGIAWYPIQQGETCEDTKIQVRQGTENKEREGCKAHEGVEGAAC